MTTAPKTAVEPEAITVAEAAARVSVSTKTVIRWIERGYLKAFFPPGSGPGDMRAGPKAIRIWLKDWEMFTSANTATGGLRDDSTPVTPAPVSAPGHATGTDGISRRKRRKAVK